MLDVNSRPEGLGAKGSFVKLRIRSEIPASLLHPRSHGYTERAVSVERAEL